MRRPLVIVPACMNEVGAHLAHTAQDKYLMAVRSGAACMPLVLPALGPATDWEAVLGMADGVLLSGSPSNVAASAYGGLVQDASLPQDGARDATTLPLIRAALKRGIPVLGICRGLQEMNVALGGSLHQAVQEVPGMLDHRAGAALTVEQEYRAAHRVLLTPDGRLARILHGAAELMVNSVHGQGIATLAPGLLVEARAADGLIEAVSADGPGFALAVQWHPEWQMAQHPASIQLFQAFGQACRRYHSERAGGRDRED